MAFGRFSVCAFFLFHVSGDANSVDVSVLGTSGSQTLVRRHVAVDGRGKPQALAARRELANTTVRTCTTFQGQTFDCSKPPEGKAIPKVVHVMYKRKLDRDVKWPNQVWKHAFDAWHKYYPEPEYHYSFWDEDSIDKQFKRHCHDHIALYQSFSNNVSRSDLSRYCILHEIGGIYADLDYEPLQNFYNSFSPGKVNLLESPYSHEILQNSLMASPPGQQFWLDLLNDDQARSAMPDPTSATGPHALDAVAFRFSKNGQVSIQEYGLRADVKILPCSQFQRRTKRFAAEEERRLDKEKPGCSMLNLDNFKTMKGIHWGTWSWRTGQLGGKVDCHEIQKLWGVIHGFGVQPRLNQALLSMEATYD